MRKPPVKLEGQPRTGLFLNLTRDDDAMIFAYIEARGYNVRRHKAKAIRELIRIGLEHVDASSKNPVDNQGATPSDSV